MGNQCSFAAAEQAALSKASKVASTKASEAKQEVTSTPSTGSTASTDAPSTKEVQVQETKALVMESDQLINALLAAESEKDYETMVKLLTQFGDQKMAEAMASAELLSDPSSRCARLVVIAVGYYNAALVVARKYSVEGADQRVLETLLESDQKCFESVLSAIGGGDAKNIFTSETVTKRRQMLIDMRERAAKELQAGGKSAVKSVMEDITKTLSELIKDMGTQMPGEAPTKFAVIGLGSVGRNEAAPFSDLEYAVLVESVSEETVKYVKAQTFLLQLASINLGETSDFGRFDGVSLLDNPVADGFGFDEGGNVPSQKFEELVGTPEQLASVQNHKAWDDIARTNLLWPSLIFGDASLVESYKEKLAANLPPSRGIAHIKDFLGGFGVEFKVLTHVNVKRHLYRLFHGIIGGVSLYYGILDGNTWNQIAQLKEKGAISEEVMNELFSTIDTIASFRTRTHLHYSNQVEELYHSKGDSDGDTLFLLSKEDIEAIVEVYRVNMTLEEQAKEFIKKAEELQAEDADARVSEFATSTGDSLHIKATAAYRAQQWEAAEELFTGLLKLQPEAAAYALEYLSSIYYQLQRWSDASSSLKDLLEKNIETHGSVSGPVATTHENLGLVSVELDQVDKAITEDFGSALEIKQKLVESNSLPSIALASTYKFRGSAYLKKAESSETDLSSSLEDLNKAETLEREAGLPKLGDLASTLKLKSEVFNKMGKKEEAFKSHKEAIEIEKGLYGRQHATTDGVWKTLLVQVGLELLKEAGKVALEMAKEEAKRLAKAELAKHSDHAKEHAKAKLREINPIKGLF